MDCRVSRLANSSAFTTNFFSRNPRHLMEKGQIPGLVNIQKANWKDPPFSMGKSTISTGSFSMSQTVTKWPFFGLSWIANPSHLRRHSFLSFQIFNTGEVEHVTTFFSVPWKIWSHQISDIHGPCLFGTMTGWRFGTWLLFTISYMGCHPKPIDELHHFSRWLKQPPSSYWYSKNHAILITTYSTTFCKLWVIINDMFDP